jgi:hypothetical protein
VPTGRVQRPRQVAYRLEVRSCGRWPLPSGLAVPPLPCEYLHVKSITLSGQRRRRKYSLHKEITLTPSVGRVRAEPRKHQPARRARCPIGPHAHDHRSLPSARARAAAVGSLRSATATRVMGSRRPLQAEVRGQVLAMVVCATPGTGVLLVACLAAASRPRLPGGSHLQGSGSGCRHATVPARGLGHRQVPGGLTGMRPKA